MVFLFLVSPPSSAAPASMGGWSDLMSRQRPVSPAVKRSDQLLTLSGKVVDQTGQPVTGAEVELYRREDRRLLSDTSDLRPLRRITTGADGAFEFELPPTGAILFASCPGLGPVATALWAPNQHIRDERLVLVQPATLLGRVVDESGKPVAEAEVWVMAGYFHRPVEGEYQYYPYVNALPRRPELSARTDAEGRFRIPGCPTNACLDLAVHKVGKALRPAERRYISPETMQGRPGLEEIKLVMVPAGTIEGKVLAGEKGSPLAGVRLVLASRQPGSSGYRPVAPIYSGGDGSFRIAEILPGAYQVRAFFETNAPWVAPFAPATVEAGQTTTIEIQATPGSLLEMVILDQGNRKPIAAADLQVFGENFHANASSDADGRTTFRLPAGQYQVSASRLNSQPASVTASVKANQTNRLEIELSPAPEIAGVVRDPSGAPVPDLELTIFPNYRTDAGALKTDAVGRYRMTWNHQRSGGMNETPSLLARDEKRNLTASGDIEEGTTTLDLQLEPGLVVSGRVEDSQGRPLTNATIQLHLWSGNMGTTFTRKPFTANAQARFEISALPPNRRYSLYITATGYGSASHEIQEGEAEDNRVDLESIVLQVADQILAGQVLGEDEKPITRARVSIYGRGQPNSATITDGQGRFKFDQVCEGAAHVNASTPDAYGSARCSAGETNVIVQLRSRGSSPSLSRSVPKRPSLKDKPLPSLDSFHLPEDCAPAGKPILLCLFDLEQRPSRRVIRLLAEQHDALKQKGLTVLGLQSAITTAEALQEYRQDSPAPFPIGRVGEKSDQAKWAATVESLPWLILANASHQVVAEGFAIEELDTKLGMISK